MKILSKEFHFRDLTPSGASVTVEVPGWGDLQVLFLSREVHRAPTLVAGAEFQRTPWYPALETYFEDYPPLLQEAIRFAYRGLID